MNTKKESSLSTISDITNNDYVRLLTSSGESGKVRLYNILNNLLISATLTGVDLNELHKTSKIGLTLYSLTTTSSNVNAPESAGTCVHFQRTASDNTTSQIILQIYFNKKVWLRNGKGNGTSVDFSDWREI